MEKNIDQTQEFKDYFSYVKKELSIMDTKSSISILDRINEIDTEELDVEKVRFIVKSIEFVNRMDKTQIAIYSEWWKYIREY